jgi:hypothetical protein
MVTITLYKPNGDVLATYTNVINPLIEGSVVSFRSQSAEGNATTTLIKTSLPFMVVGDLES